MVIYTENFPAGELRCCIFSGFMMTVLRVTPGSHNRATGDDFPNEREISGSDDSSHLVDDVRPQVFGILS